MSRILIVSLLLGALVFAGCSASKEEKEVAGVIQNYLSLMQVVYDRADLSLLYPIASDKELKKVFPTIQALQATGNRMKTEILEFKVKAADVQPSRATVTTAEKWRFWWVDEKSGSITKQKSEESYHLEYNLIKVDNRWKVDYIRNRNE
ncbi:MAG TPA: hypothetical protein DCZ75_18100 [Geobacter sp.]|nr:hypothetical protein [Geobacter sp.]